MSACRATSAARAAWWWACPPPYPFPDAHGHGIEADQEPTYDVRFDARDLWSDSADPAFVHVGVFESYLRAREVVINVVLSAAKELS